jgi:transcriptional regulator with GAF, ATPase, and Fis domain
MSIQTSEHSAKLFVSALQSVLKQVAEPNQVLGIILDQAVTQTGADRGLFVEITSDGELEYQVLHQFDRAELSGKAGQFSRTLFGRVIETGRHVMLASTMGGDDAPFAPTQSMQALGPSILCMPIVTEGRVVALVHLESKRVSYFKPAHVELLGSLVELAGPVLETLKAGRDVLRDRSRLQVSEKRFREEAEASREFLNREWSFGRYVGRSEAVRALEDMVRKAAPTDFPILLLGETGTGKSIVARVIHHSGPRAKQAFVTVFCPSLRREMVEAELFGHKRGAFTGADRDNVGKIQAADKGTIFLDEIGELPLEIQPKLLRLLQERTYERVGDAQERTADVRLIAATNRDLEEEVRAGRFRRDLYERLNFIPIRLPSLRERREDIPLLLRHCLDQSAAGRWAEIAPEALDFLATMEFAWPGNVRTLEQLAARLTLRDGKTPVSRAELLEALDTQVRMDAPAASAPVTPSAAPGTAAPAPGNANAFSLLVRMRSDLDVGLPALMAEAEKACLEEAIRRYPKLTRAELAAKLKIGQATLFKKLREYQIED